MDDMGKAPKDIATAPPPAHCFSLNLWGLPLFQFSLVFLATLELLRLPESDQLAVFNFASG